MNIALSATVRVRVRAGDGEWESKFKPFERISNMANFGGYGVPYS